MVQLFLDRGVHPHDQGELRFLEGNSIGFEVASASASEQGLSAALKTHPWSSWATAIASGRTDVLELLARHADNARPPDHTPAIWVALNAAMHNPSRVEETLTALSWFLDRYPPTLEERAAVAQTFFRRGGGGSTFSTDPLVLWLALPQSTLRHPEGPLETPEDFNPWSCIDQTSLHIEPHMDRLAQVLAKHPRWGNAKALLDAPWTRTWDLVRDPRMKECSILADWIHSSRNRQLSEREGALPPTVDQIFSRLDGLKGLEDHSLPRVFLWMRLPPGAEASAWLSKNPKAWLGRETPWHHGPCPAIQEWLCEMQISPWAPDERGVAKGLVERLKDWDIQAAKVFIDHTQSLLKDASMDWGQCVEGFSLAQWAHGSSRTPGMSPLKGWDAGALAVAVLLGDIDRIDCLLENWKKEGSPAPTNDEEGQIMDAWARGSSRFLVPPKDMEWKKEEAGLRQKILASLLDKGMISPDFLAKSNFQGRGWLWRRMMGLNEYDAGSRRDMATLWEAHWESEAALTTRDRWALALWAMDSTLLRSDDVIGAPVGPASSPMWGRLPEEEKVWLAQATILLARRKTERLDALFGDAFAREFAGGEDIALGANAGRVQNVLDFLEHKVVRMYEKEGLSMPSIFRRWTTLAHARKMKQEMPSAASRTPRLGGRGRF